VNAITVIDAATALFNLAVTFMPERTTGVNAHQTSAVPSCPFDRTALVHVMAPLLFVTLLTTVLAAQHGSGASVDTNATSNVFAAAAINGLEIVVACALELRVTVAAIVGGGPVDTTRSTALPTGTFFPASGAWLMTVPFGKIALA
jgi:hypothetical protein